MDTFLIIDGNSLAYRAYYALPLLSNRKGEPTGAIYGFCNILVKFISEYRPKYIAVCFDHAKKTFRNEIFEGYKGTRKETPPALLEQFDKLKNLLKMMGIKVFEMSSFEADDIIGTLSKGTNQQTIILSGDRDLLQLIDSSTVVWLTKKGISELVRVDENSIVDIYNVTPSQVVDLKALMGDSSDNIPGVPGVGEKTAESLISLYGSLDGVYQHIEEVKGKLKEKLISGKESAYMSYKLATIKTDCDIKIDLDEFLYEFPFNNMVRQFFDENDFNSLLKKADIFSNQNLQTSKHNEAQRVALTKENIDILKEIKSPFCFDLSCLEFFIDGKVFYLPKEIDFFSANFIETEDLFSEIKYVFEDESILKISSDIKSVMHELQNYGIKLKGEFFDLKLASYLITAGEKLGSNKLKVEDYLNLKDEYIYKLKDMGLMDLFTNIETPLIKVLFDMEQSGFKIDKQELDRLKIQYDSELHDIQKLIYNLADEEFNINSPKQLAFILFDKLGLKAINNKKNSTNIEILTEIEGQHPIVTLIIRHRKLQKLLCTYIDVYQDSIKENGDIIHTVFHQMLTSTGRLSSSEPNLQNIPIRDEEGKGLRKLFISKFEDGLIMSADYNQIELRLLAHLSGDENLISTFNNGGDVHTETACSIFHLKKEDVTPSLRRAAKAINFGIIYGISDYGLSQNIGCTRREAKEYMTLYFEKYPKVKEFMDNNVNSAREHGYAKTMFGRIRKIPEIHSSNFNMRTFGERVAMNMPLQGSASDIIKLAMISVQKKLKMLGLKSELILQIHDELIIDTLPDEKDVVLDIIKTSMENVVELAVKLPVSLGVGKNLYDS